MYENHFIWLFRKEFKILVRAVSEVNKSLDKHLKIQVVLFVYCFTLFKAANTAETAQFLEE